DPTRKRTLFEDPKSWDHFYCALHDRNFPDEGKKGIGRNVTGGKVGWAHWRAAEGGDLAQPDGINNQEVIRVLEEIHDQPFFIGYGIHKPHDPFVAPKEYFDFYPEESVQLAVQPANRSERNDLSIPGKGGSFKGMTDQDRLEFKRAYRAGVSFADAQIGKLFDAMSRLDLWKDTIVILMGDHGYHLGEHDWWNKVTLYEWGARAPMIIWVPEAKGMGQSTDAIMEFIDLYPTLVDYAGLKAPHELSGTSLRPILEDPSLPGKEAAYTQVTRGNKMGFSIRTKRWRYTEWGPDGEFGRELYDHKDDPGEYFNLSNNPEYSNLIKELSNLLDQGFTDSRS
ncbi:MAG: sulfatase-like hydrolase/transferase, partial [Verrucomicrobiota bacterium]